MRHQIDSPDKPPAEKLAEQVQEQYGEYADEYAAASAIAAWQLGAKARSDKWEQVDELLAQHRNRDE